MRGRTDAVVTWFGLSSTSTKPRSQGNYKGALYGRVSVPAPALSSLPAPFPVIHTRITSRSNVAPVSGSHPACALIPGPARSIRLLNH